MASSTILASTGGFAQPAEVELLLLNSNHAGKSNISNHINEADSPSLNLDAPNVSSQKQCKLLQAHRENHNPSKLPAFRFADLKKPTQEYRGLALPHQNQEQQQQGVLVLYHDDPTPVLSGSTTIQPKHPEVKNHLQQQQEQQQQHTITLDHASSTVADLGQPVKKPAAIRSDSGSTSTSTSTSISTSSTTPATNRSSTETLKPKPTTTTTTTTKTTSTTITAPTSASTHTKQNLHTSSTTTRHQQSSPIQPSPLTTSSTGNSTVEPTCTQTFDSAGSPSPSLQPSIASSKQPSPIPLDVADCPASLPADLPSYKPDSDTPQHSNTTTTTTTTTATTANTPPSSTASSAPRASGHRRSDPSFATPPTVSKPRRQFSLDVPERVVAHPVDPSSTTSDSEQRDPSLSKPAQEDQADDKRKFQSRPPVSFRPLRGDNSGVRVPPIRSFRSSGSRKSWTLDMPPKAMRSPRDEGAHADGSTDHHDRTLWALEGRSPADPQMTPPDSAVATPDADNTADIFMRIASEDAPRAAPTEGDHKIYEPSAISRLARSSHRRPLSAAIPLSHTPTSPPQVTRRLSDQRETHRFQRASSEQPSQQMARDPAQRTITARDRSDDRPPRSKILGPPPSLKSSPAGPRSPVTQEAPEGAFSYTRRRTSVTESTALNSRASTIKTSAYAAQPRAYNSSPLVPRQAEPAAPEPVHGLGVEGTESSASTAAPSTVWDELDDIRSRIHRLELTGKVPATSGHAMSRASDERPRTANTNATTLSGSPKRPGANLNADASSTTSSQREAQPILLSAVSKAKPYLSNDAFGALESAASEALSLSQMMGSPGQPGPISSGASTIWGGSSVTDRQLRRKADSICRSLTELCLSIADDAAQKNNTRGPETPRDKESSFTSPIRSFSITAASQRRTAPAPDSGLSRINTTISPRTLTKTEERRANMLSSGVLPSPRYALSPATPSVEPSMPATGRRSSLLISRTRRAGTEEPEDSSGGRKPSLLMRTRRAGTEEPDEGRKTSLLLRTQRAAYAEDEDESPRLRAPSRAATELGTIKNQARDYVGQQQQAVIPSVEAPNLLDAPPTRRRLISSSITSRLVAPSVPPLSTFGRRYLDRSTPERDNGSATTEKFAEERVQRQFGLGQGGGGLNRTNSLHRRRDSGIPSFAGSSAASHVGSFR